MFEPRYIIVTPGGAPIGLDYNLMPFEASHLRFAEMFVRPEDAQRKINRHMLDAKVVKIEFVLTPWKGEQR